MAGINAKWGDRWAIIGATGSGKTVFCRQLLIELANATRGQFPIYIIDSKAAGDFKHFTRKGVGVHYQTQNLPPLYNKDRSPFIVWTPDEDDTDLYNDFFFRIYQNARKNAQPALIYIDELGSITNARGTQFPRYYDILLKQGRGMAGGGVGVISTTQSPSFIPPNLLRQATHIVRMRLNDEWDAKKLAGQLGKESATKEPTDPFGFYYRNCTKPRKTNPTVYYKNMQEFFTTE